MPRTVDHIVAAHQEAGQRRKTGRKVWDETINFTSFFQDEEMDLLEKRDKIVAAIKHSTWYKRCEEYDELWELVDEMEGFGHADTEDCFNYLLDTMYDIADLGEWRVWIKTF